MAKKTTVRKQSKPVDTKYTPEQQQKWSESERKMAQHGMFNELNYNYGNKDLKPDVARWMQETGEYDNKAIKRFNQLPDAWIHTSTCKLARAWRNGWLLNDSEVAHMKQSIKTYLDRNDEIKEDAPAKKKETALDQIKTIQDRLQEKTNENLAHFDGMIDELIKGKKIDPKAFEFFKANNVPQAQLNKYEEYAATYVDELKEAQNTDDEDLKEGYKHFKAADFKRFYTFFEKFVEAIEAYRQVKKQTKKARVKRAPNKEKAVSKMKYLKEDNNLKLVSINPVDIIGAEELWVYNTKTRKLFKYVSDSLTGPLNVKGTTILGYDSAKSIGKTIRKPDQKLLEFMKAGKVQLRKFLDEIKATSIPANGRINKDILLLKAL